MKISIYQDPRGSGNAGNGTGGAYLLVADLTRRDTLETARLLQRRVTDSIGPLPFIFLLNKADLTDEQEVEDEAITACETQGWQVFKTSAKTGHGVEEAFTLLAEKTWRR